MNKAQLIEAMHKNTNLPRSTCKVALEGFMISVIDSLKEHESVNLTGFGSFVCLNRKSRLAMNPHTHKKMTIPAKTVIRFRPARHIKTI